MKRKRFMPIIGGALVGAGLFFAGPLIFLVLLLKFIFTPFGMGRMMMQRRFAGPWGASPEMRWAMAEKIRSMSAEEFAGFKEKMSARTGCHQYPNPNSNQ